MVGTLPKDKMVGKFVQEWTAAVASSDIDIKEVDAAPGVSALLAVKDEDEIVSPVFRSCRSPTHFLLSQRNELHAAKMTNQLMSHFSDVMSSDIDSGKKVTHEQLGEQIEAKLEDSKFWRKLELGNGVRRSSLSLGIGTDE